jgi:AraC-like DNA-binding protein
MHHLSEIRPEAEENLARRDGVYIETSQAHPVGGGARDPHVLLNDTAHRLDGAAIALFDRSKTFDTYRGQQPEQTLPDWYRIGFPQQVAINCIEMTMGYPHRDGGWWTSLQVEYRTAPQENWQVAAPITITPPYDFRDTREGRRPFTSHTLTFETLHACQIRLIGMPGGFARLTSLARIAVYHRDLSRWNPLPTGNPPLPHLFRLIEPKVVFDFSENLAEVTGLTVGLPLLEYYLDAHRYERFWQRLSPNYHNEPELWFLLGERLGWYTWNRLYYPMEAGAPIPEVSVPHVHPVLNKALAYAIAPVIVDGEKVGALTASTAIVKDWFDWDWHRQNAHRFDIPWDQYAAAVARTPQMHLRQLQATAELLGMIANTIANLVHRLDRALDAHTSRQHRKNAIRQAIDYMEAHIEDRVSIAQVAKAVDLTLPHFSAAFTAETGQNPSDFLLSLRIERAKQYLSYTQMTVNQVADVLGYSPSHFSRLFKNRTGMAPLHYLLRSRGMS